MPSETTIRDIQTADLDSYYDLFMRVLTNSFPEYSTKTIQFMSSKIWNKESYQKKITKIDGYFLGAYKDNQLVGLMDAHKPFGGVSWYSWLMVDCDFIGQGIGTKLIEALQGRVLNDKGHALYLGGDKRNINFYISRGFKHVGTIEKGWFGHTEYLLLKHLQEPIEENFLR